MNFCKDCKWIIQNTLNDPLCGHPSVADPVTGASQTSCTIARATVNLCGREGKLFEAEEPPQ